MQNPAGFVSCGFPVGDVPSMKRGVAAIVSRISRDLFLADLDAHEQRMTGDVAPEFAEELYAAALWPGRPSASHRADSAPEFAVGFREQPREALGPGGLACEIGEQVLADFDLDMREAAPLAMHRYGVVGQVADPVRLVFADDEIGLAAQQLRKSVRQTGIAVEQDGHMPRPRDPFEYRSKAVQRHQDRLAARRCAAVERGGDRIMVGPEDRFDPRCAVRPR